MGNLVASEPLLRRLEDLLAFGALGTKLICCRELIRWAEWFSGRLDVSGPLVCEI